jgi:hypothetical protein
MKLADRIKNNMKLISMTDFVLEQNEKFKKDIWTAAHYSSIIICYARFLKQPLKLEMFIPCDDEGNVLKFDYPQNKAFDEIAQEAFEKQYEQEKEKVLFEGFSPADNSFDFKTNYQLFRVKDYKTIEDFIKENNRVELILTESAIKILGL